MAKSREINMNLPSADDLFTTQEERDQKNQEHVKNISVYAHRKNRADILKKLQEEVLPKLVSLDLGILLEEQKEGVDEIFLSWLQENHPGAPVFSRLSSNI